MLPTFSTSSKPLHHQLCPISKRFLPSFTNDGLYIFSFSKKLNYRPRIYVGSGTDARDGVSARLRRYGKGGLLGRFVTQALDEGYIIQHKGLLCWTSIPSADIVPILRLLFVPRQLEATFTWFFWAVNCKTEYGYDMTDICQWAWDKLGYDGCGSHNPLSESPAGDIGLSAEELEAQALEWSRLRLDYIKEWKRKKVAGPNGSEYKAQVNEARRAYLKRKPEVAKTQHNVSLRRIDY